MKRGLKVVFTPSRRFSLYVKNRGFFSYEGFARKIQDFGLDFPHGKRNKIILAGRELDTLIEAKLGEIQKQTSLKEKLHILE